jgi:hypothetical protein
MELSKNARCVEACFGDEFIWRVGAGGEKGGETRDGGGVWCTGAAHDYGYDVDHCAWPVVSDGVRKGCVFGVYEVSCVREVIVCAVLPFPYLDFFDGCVTSATVGVTNESGFEDADEVRFVCRGTKWGGENLRWEDGGARGEGIGRETFVSSDKAGGHVGGVRWVAVKWGAGRGGGIKRFYGFVTEVCGDGFPSPSVVAFQ